MLTKSTSLQLKVLLVLIWILSWVVLGLGLIFPHIYKHGLEAYISISWLLVMSTTGLLFLTFYKKF